MSQNMLKISEALTLGLHACVLIGSNGSGSRPTTVTMAAKLSSSAAHLSKVMRALVRAGLVKSIAGPGGGFEMKREPADICLIDIYKAVEGEFPESNCLLNPAVCAGNGCVLGKFILGINVQVKDFFVNTTLKDLINK